MPEILCPMCQLRLEVEELIRENKGRYRFEKLPNPCPLKDFVEIIARRLATKGISMSSQDITLLLALIARTYPDVIGTKETINFSE